MTFRSMTGVALPATAQDRSADNPAHDPAAVVAFWRDAGPALWFARDDGFDRRFRERFLAAHEAAARGALDGWRVTAEDALALVLLLDQFPRNAFRGTPQMYATDSSAQLAANAAIDRRFDVAVGEAMALFFYLPFAHAENLAHQDRALALCARLGEDMAARARHHRDIVRRFGRFPHRNAILGRTPGPEERRFLEEGGYAG